MADKVLYGLDSVHVAFVSTTSPYTWEDPIPIPGAVNFTCDPEQAEQSFYADNVRYYYSNKNNGYTGELEMALVPEAILAEMLGWEIDDNGMLLEIADGKPKEFALLARCEGDEAGRKWVYYRCVASRPSEAHATSAESETIATTKLSLRVLPVSVGRKERSQSRSITGFYRICELVQRRRTARRWRWCTDRYKHAAVLLGLHCYARSYGLYSRQLERAAE